MASFDLMIENLINRLVLGFPNKFPKLVFKAKTNLSHDQPTTSHRKTIDRTFRHCAYHYHTGSWSQHNYARSYGIFYQHYAVAHLSVSNKEKISRNTRHYITHFINACFYCRHNLVFLGTDNHVGRRFSAD